MFAARLLPRLEPAVVAGLTGHAAVVWYLADPGVRVWSGAGILGMLGVLALAGLARPGGQWWALVRGGFGLAVLLLVGQLAGAVPGPLELWFGLLAFGYPLALPPGQALAVPPLVAGSYFAAALFAEAPLATSTASIRGLVVFGVGAVGCLLGAATRRLRGKQNRTEGRLREAEGVLQAAFEGASSGMAVLDLEGNLLQVNQALCDLLGRPSEDLVGTAWSGHLHPDDAGQHGCAVERLVAGEAWSIKKEIRLRLKDRRTAWGLVGMSLVHDAAARPRHLFLHVTNLTDRVRAEARLGQSEAHFRNLFEMSPIPLWEVDLSGVVAHFERWHSEGATDLAAFLQARPDQAHLAAVGAAVRRVNGAARAVFRAAGTESFAQQVASGSLGPGYHDALMAQVDALWRGQTHHEIRADLTDAGGAAHTGTLRVVVPTVEGRPDVASVVVSFTDLTDHLRARDQLRRVEDRLRTVIAGAPIVVFAVDEHGVFTFSEGQGLRSLGLAPGEAVGRSVFEMYRESPAVIQAMRRALGGEAFGVTVAMGDLVFDTRYSPMWEDGRVVGVIGVAQDVTEQARAADRLRQLVRAKDEFVATVSHELRTPLTAVVGFSHELRDRLERLDPEEVRTFIDLIGDQATEVTDLVEDLLVASRLDLDDVAVTRDAIHLWDQVDAVLAARRIGKEVTTVRHEQEAKVFADPVRVRQIFRNLVANADCYGGPHITVRVDRFGDALALSVIDDGAGIPEAERGRVFDPYCRAHKEAGRTESVGLGLTVSRQLARLMSGDLSYDYRSGHSIFTVTLPAV
ncbi:MAG: PAS domain S-box protein [Actinomycetota bacterium]